MECLQRREKPVHGERLRPGEGGGRWGGGGEMEREPLA